MTERRAISETEAIYRDLVLQELKGLNEQQKFIASNISNVSERLSNLETVVIGIDKTNGLRGEIRKIQEDIDVIKPLAVALDNMVNNKDKGLLNDIMVLNKKVDILEKFKIKLISIYSAIQVFVAVMVFLATKFKWFD
jgi:hypothetical protein